MADARGRAKRRPFAVRLRDLLIGNWQNKLFALFLALVVWFNLYQSQEMSGTFEFVVDLVPADGNVIVSESVEVDGAPGRAFGGSVTLQVVGQQSDLEGLRDRARRVTFRLPADSVGRVDLANPIPYELPGGVSIQGADPAVLLCEIEALVSRDLPVQQALEGTPAPGLRVRNVAFRPARVEVRGPRGALDPAPGRPRVEVFSETIRLQGERESFQTSVELRLRGLSPEYDGKVSIVGTTTATAEVQLESAVEQRTFRVGVRYTCPPTYWISEESAQSVDVILEGPPSALDEIAKWEDRFFADVPVHLAKTKTRRTFARTPGFTPALPPGVQFVDIPGDVIYWVREVRTEDLQTDDEGQK